MSRDFHNASWIRTTAKLVFGAVLFLLVASYLALPCLTADNGQFRGVAGAASCSEHKLFKPQADLCRLFQAPTEAPMRFAAVLALALVSTFVSVSHLPRFTRFKQRWKIRLGSLPFATADPSFLPAFAALRDA